MSVNIIREFQPEIFIRKLCLLHHKDHNSILSSERVRHYHCTITRENYKKGMVLKFQSHKRTFVTVGDTLSK